MTTKEWPEWIDDAVERARFGPGDDFWTSADVVVNTLGEDSVRYLAVLGLAELAAWSHKIDRDRQYPCAGREIAFARYFPDMDLTEPDEE